MAAYQKRYKAFVQILYLSKDMSVSELHKKTKGRLSRQTIYNWKRGYTLYPRFDSMEIVLNSLGMEFRIMPKEKKKTVEAYKPIPYHHV